MSPRKHHLVSLLTIILPLSAGLAGLGLAAWQAVVEVQWAGMVPGVLWVHPTGGFGCAITMAVLGLALLAMGASAARMRRLEREVAGRPVRAALSSTKRARLVDARRYLPAELPDSWSEPVSVSGSVAWTFMVKDVLVTVWTSPADEWPTLHVALARKGSDGRVSDLEALEIFAAFAHVTEFMEVESPPTRILGAHPKARAWMALPKEVAAALPRPERLPIPAEKPLNQHLVAARKHLPEKLPIGWSVPVAVTEEYEGWDDGAWMVHDDDAVVLACLVTSRGRIKLAVTIFHADQSEISEARAMSVLKHFRHVSEFVQTDAAGIEGGRMYLGEIQKKDSRALLN